MSLYQNIINEYRGIRDNVRFEYVNKVRDSQVYQQYMAQTEQPATHNINSIFTSLFGMGPSNGFISSPLFSSPNVSISYGTVPMAATGFAPLNLFDAITQMMNQTQHINQDDVKLVLKKSELDKLPKLTPEQLKQQLPSLTQEDVCPLCLEGYFTEKKIVCSILPCGHHFCHPCIYKELSEYRHVCPLCKNNVGEYEAKI